MIYKVFVKKLAERILHIASYEAHRKDVFIKKISAFNDICILSVDCDSPSYLIDLVETLETDSQTHVVAVKDTRDRYIDLNTIEDDAPKFPWVNTGALAIQRDDYAAFL